VNSYLTRKKRAQMKFRMKFSEEIHWMK